MGLISSIVRCFRCKVEDNELDRVDENNHSIWIESQSNLSNDVPFVSTGSEECVNPILSALSSRTTEVIYDLNYGVDTSSNALGAPTCLPSRGIDALSPLCQQYLWDRQGYETYRSGTSDTLQQNGLSSQSSFFSHEECNNQQIVVDERWIKCYSSCHMILLVGDGDFSFSACLAKAFGSASNMIATSLDSREFLRLNYSRAISNIQDLERRGCRVIHEMDCTKMADNVLLKGLAFDRIVYNFPYAGFFKNKSRESQLRLHQKLVKQFMENAKKMISKKGEIHINHKTNGFHHEWNLEHLALIKGLRFIEAVHFNHFDYPGYRTKTGFGGDNNFNCNPSKTYKFGLRNC